MAQSVQAMHEADARMTASDDRIARDQAAQLPGKRADDAAWVGPEYPVRLRSANGLPPLRAAFLRSCRRCHADFFSLAPGKTGERGLWDECLHWWCSQECYDLDHVEAPDA